MNNVNNKLIEKIEWLPIFTFQAVKLYERSRLKNHLWKCRKNGRGETGGTPPSSVGLVFQILFKIISYKNGFICNKKTKRLKTAS